MLQTPLSEGKGNKFKGCAHRQDWRALHSSRMSVPLWCFPDKVLCLVSRKPIISQLVYFGNSVCVCLYIFCWFVLFYFPGRYMQHIFQATCSGFSYISLHFNQFIIISLKRLIIHKKEKGACTELISVLKMLKPAQ